MDFPAYNDPGREDEARLTLESGLDGPRDDEGEGVTAGEERDRDRDREGAAAERWTVAAADEVAAPAVGATEPREDDAR